MEYQNEPGQPTFPGDQDPVRISPPPPPQAPQVDDIPPLKPSNWLWQSIVVTILCCVPFPLGILGIIYAARVDSLYFRGNYEEAERSAQKAKMWTLIALGTALLYGIFWTIMAITGNLPEYLENIIESNASGYNF